ncbi:dUTP diphosphatase [bacterium]|nr:dUTP diphosphatase [bacterium]NBW99719.1 dUTP diphosphatase [bacterium]NBX83520.1 dUTP diphosphatase [bacterium]
MISVQIKKMHPQAEIPKYMTPGSAGCDIKACLPEPLEIRPGERLAVPTGLAFGIPEGYEIQVRPRSGLAIKQGITVVNAPGTIDSDYRGEVMVLLINLGKEPVRIAHGDRIAQCVLQKVNQVDWTLVESLENTQRGAGGFGSTG